MTDSAKPDRKSQIYLAEVSSFGGNSGSPVFLRLGTLREELSVNMKVGYTYHLLGVMKGFVSDEEAKQNTGIALVVPCDKILEVLSGERVKALIARAVAEDRVAKDDMKAAETKFQESIGILEKQAPESSQLVATLRSLAINLERAKRVEDARVALSKAQKIAAQPVTKAPQP